MSNFGRDQIVACRHSGLSYHSIAAHVSRDPMIVCRKWNRWFQKGSTENLAGFKQPVITNNREDKHFTSVTLMDRIFPPWAIRLRNEDVYKTPWAVSHCFGYPLRCTTNRSAFRDAFIDEPGSRNGVSRVTRRISILFTASRCSKRCLTSSWRTHVSAFHFV